MKNDTDLTTTYLGFLLDCFWIKGEIISAESWRSGHINRTYCVTVRYNDTERRYVVQAVNSRVFRNIDALMENAFRVSDYVVHAVAAERGITPEEAARTEVRYLPATQNRTYIPGPTGDAWRIYPCIENAASYLVAETPSLAYEAARTFGRFQRLLQGLPARSLSETIPDFHNTPKRFARLAEVADQDPLGRRAAVAADLDAILSRAERGGALQKAFADGVFPERVAHNDTKMSNVLLDERTGKGICAIDLDTVMPGYSLHDFGDLMRSSCNPEEEDTEDLDAIRIRFDIFEAITRGFLSETRGLFSREEAMLLPEAGWAMTIENAVRFLTDHLEGDVYFRISREGQNLVRARSQLAFAKQIEEAMPRLRQIVEQALA